MKISTLYPSQSVLAESPFWHAARNSGFWVDIHTGTLYEVNWRTRETKQQHISSYLSLIVEGCDNHVLLAVQGGVMKMALDTGHRTWLKDIDKEIHTNRCNDGACDAAGNLWIGTLDTGCANNAGGLYRLDKDGGLHKMISDLTIPNGLVWSMQNDRMYFIDTPSQRVFCYLYDINLGEIKFEKVAIEIPVTMGMPDGMTIDAEGMLWVALYKGGCITRWDPRSGALLETISLPALNITSCAFAGENLDSLLVTSARENLTPSQLRQYPESGNVFLVEDIPYRGLPNNVAHPSF
jgi:sugar lactone lactonase YvrE